MHKWRAFFTSAGTQPGNQSNLAPGSELDIYKEEAYSLGLKKMLGFLQFISWQYCWKGERRGTHSELTLSFWNSLPHRCPPSYLPAVACFWSLSGATEDIGILLSCCFFLLHIRGCFVSPCLFIKYLTFSFHLQEICEISHLPMVSFFYNMSLLLRYYSTGVLGKGKKLCVQPFQREL